MYTYLWKVERSDSRLHKIADLFYEKYDAKEFWLENGTILFDKLYWADEVPLEVQDLCNAEFKNITSKSIRKMDYLDSGLDEFQYFLAVFLRKIEKIHPKLRNKISFKKYLKKGRN